MDAKSCYGALLMAMMRMMGKDATKKFDAQFRFHRRLNLKNPQTLADKVIYLENHCPSPMAARCTDKWEVRSYVVEKGFADILVPVHGPVCRSFDEIPFDDYPDRFVLKATHGCKMNYFCTNKAALDMTDCRRTLTKWLNTTYGTYSGEWHYFDIPHRIYCEDYLDNTDKIIDYKFFCMNGIPQFVQTCANRDASGKRMHVEHQIFDMDWRPLQGLIEATENYATIQPPLHLAQMIKIAKELSRDFTFVRVDLYELNDCVYFGELTFTPANGVLSHYSTAFLQEMGDRLHIDPVG